MQIYNIATIKVCTIIASYDISLTIKPENLQYVKLLKYFSRKKTHSYT